SCLKERVIARPCQLHRFPFALLADGGDLARFAVERHQIDDPRRDRFSHDASTPLFDSSLDTQIGHPRRFLDLQATGARELLGRFPYNLLELMLAALVLALEFFDLDGTPDFSRWTGKVRHLVQLFLHLL